MPELNNTTNRDFLVLPAGGNEPVIMGARIGAGVHDEIGSAGGRVIMPVVGRQAAVLRDEFGNRPEIARRILLDPTAGEILSPLLASQGDFAKHLGVIGTQQEEISANLSGHYGAGRTHTLHTLDGQPVDMPTDHIREVIVTGGRANLDRPDTRRHFAFPVLLSELIRQAQEDGLPFDGSDLKATRAIMKAAESTYTTTFIPLVNTLSYRALPENSVLSSNPGKARKHARELFSQLIANQPTDGKVVFAPPLKEALPPIDHDELLQDIPSIYAMLSGTGRGSEHVIETALGTIAKNGGLGILTNPWSELEGATKISPRVLTDPRVIAILSRAGWGTGWIAQNTATPWFVLPAEPGDDPEILYNNKVIERLGIGRVVKPGELTPKKLLQAVATHRPYMEEYRDLMRLHFGNGGNGIAFVAKSIAKSCLVRNSVTTSGS